MSMVNPGSGVLYVLVCGSPIARDVGVLVELAQAEGWEVCVITTPDGRKFVDAAALQAQTGHAVRSYYKNPGDEDLLPPADAMIVAPATVNTVNKWAAGITDTLVLGLLVEGYGFGTPTVVVPYTNRVMAMHPALHDSIAKLRDWGVVVLHGDDVVVLGGPGQNDRFRSQFPWRRALQALHARIQAPARS
ncbi:flavoprotein [Pseudosporangium ferrugineum]|uniref:Flavoprotein n=2 Tax=Pseudosporangium ferrugineum TaxID=439699 RepID=A0A2T0RCB6_9ACTN|nr:flavoprotein [Pseudosporangium ferrugineum]